MNPDYLRLFDGNEEMAKSFLEKGMDRAYGVTNVNGREEYVFSPIEDLINLPSGATPLIQEDLYNQIDSQLDSANQAHKNGTSNFFYRKVPRITLPEYMEAKAKVTAANELKSSGKQWIGTNPDYIQMREKMAKYEAGQPIEVEQVFNDRHIEKFEVSVQPSPFLSISTGANQTIGGYDILMRPKDGKPQPFMGPFFGPINPPVFRPNVKLIKENYFVVNNIQPDSRHLFEIAHGRINKSESRHVAAVQAGANIL